MKKSWDTALNVILILMIVGISVRMWLNASGASDGSELRPVYVDEWEDYTQGGISLQFTQDPSVTVVEFVDFECVFCKQTHEQLMALLNEDTTIAVVYQHYPLRVHHYAFDAAEAVECAPDEARWTLIDVLFDQQDSIGVKPWEVFADEAGIRDLKRFERCLATDERTPQVLAGIDRGRKLGVSATPTVMVEGWSFNTPPDARTIRRFIRQIKRNGRPSS